jgi:hypothetical protein
VDDDKDRRRRSRLANGNTPESDPRKYRRAGESPELVRRRLRQEFLDRHPGMTQRELDEVIAAFKDLPESVQVGMCAGLTAADLQKAGKRVPSELVWASDRGLKAAYRHDPARFIESLALTAVTVPGGIAAVAAICVTCGIEK